jgi:hypothetical protein
MTYSSGGQQTLPTPVLSESIYTTLGSETGLRRFVRRAGGRDCGRSPQNSLQGLISGLRELLAGSKFKMRCAADRLPGSSSKYHVGERVAVLAVRVAGDEK